jgi:hypothetical protein
MKTKRSYSINKSILTQLLPSVNEGRFVPFIGTEASTLRLDCSDKWEKVFKRLARLQFRLENSTDKDRDADIKYLASLAGAYGFKDEFEKSQETNKNSDDKYILEGILDDLRFYLVKAGSSLVELFGVQMAITRFCVENLSDYKVPIDEKSEEIRSVLGQLKGALDAVRNYESVRSSDDLNADSIKESLELIVHHIGFGLGDELHSIFGDSLQIELSAKPDDLNYLRLDELAWLEDLLWHTLRFDVSDYLSTNELTFRFSLLMFEPMRRRELLQIVATSRLGISPRKYLENWITKCEKSDIGDIPCRFHMVIAAALLLNYKNKKSDELLPLVFTTNFDRNLERAFKALKKPYHVIFPIKLKEKETSRQQTQSRTSNEVKDTRVSTSQETYKTSAFPINVDLNLKWVIKSCAYKGGGWKETLAVCPETDYALGEKLQGPVVVKLHGSPAEFIDDADIHELFGSETKAKHFVIMSEYDYFRTAIRASNKNIFPEAIVQQWKLGMGDWWFLGYPFDDLFTRLKMFQILSYTFEGKTPAAKALVKPTDADFDNSRMTMLEKNLNLTPLPIDLITVMETLEDKMPEIKIILREVGYV